MYTGKAYPYVERNHTRPDREVKRLFLQVMEELPERIQNISDYLYNFHGVRLTPESTDEELDQLPYLIGKLGGFRKVSDQEISAQLEAKKPFAKEVLFALFPRVDYDEETYRMLFDGALLWGEAFRYRYHQCSWFSGIKPKSSENYGIPVLRKLEGNGMEFSPVNQMRMLVYPIIEGKEPKWTVMKLTYLRAEKLQVALQEKVSE